MSNYSLSNLGWKPFFQQQLSFDELESHIPARVIEYHKNEFEVLTEDGSLSIPITKSTPQITVGDWVLLDSDNSLVRLIERSSCFQRMTAGNESRQQLIAANVDTAFIVCSLNDDFNLNRIERFLSVAYNANATPVIVLSKIDLADNPEDLIFQVQNLDSLLNVVAVNCLDKDSLDSLQGWLKPGETIVLLGSSGAGKSTLTNSLLGSNIQKTRSIREDDDKGRHTTTRRSLLILPNNAMILDTPGMRELKLTDCADGISTTFDDIEALSVDCQFNDCKHEAEPGCAVLKAIENHVLDERRLINYKKLLREEELNTASVAERRDKDKKLGKFYKRTLKESNDMKRNR